MSTPNPFDALLEPDVPGGMSPEKRAALAATLRRQYDYGTIGQLMGVEPTVRAGENMQQGAMGTLKLTLDKQLNADENRRRAMERQQAQENWQRDFNAEQANRANRLEMDLLQERRLNNPPPKGPNWRLNTETGEYYDANAETPPEGGGRPGPRPGDVPGHGFANAPPVKMTETEAKSRFYAQNMAMSLPRIVQHLQNGYRPKHMDIMAAGPQMTGVAGIVQQNIPRSMADPIGREFYTEGRTILAAILRKESGAAITDEEWKAYGPMWLPWPGDSDEEIERKIERLKSNMHEMAMGAGKAASSYWSPPQMGQGLGQSDWSGSGGTGAPKVYRYDAQGNPVD